MIEIEAIREVAYLKGLFPRTTDEQLDWWTLRLTKPCYTPAAVRRAIDQFAEHHSEHIDRAGLLALIGDQSAKTYAPRDPTAERAAADNHWAEVDATIAALSEERREQLRADALADMPEDAREFLARKGDRPGRMLRAVMFSRLRGTPAGT